MSSVRDVTTAPFNAAEPARGHGDLARLTAQAEYVARLMTRYGLVIVVAWIGAMKFTAYEAAGISGFVANSPLMGWVYHVLSQREFSAVLGVVEIAIAALIASKPVAPRLAVVGAGAAIGMFLTTLSFLITTPGVFAAEAGGFPALSVVPGQFLLKDVILLAAAVWLLADALRAVNAAGTGRLQSAP